VILLLSGALPPIRTGVDDSLSNLHLMAEIAASLSYRNVAPFLYDRMLPAAGAFATAVSLFYGSVDLSRGRLASVRGRFDDSERHIASGGAMHARIGSPLFRARSWTDQAELCLTRNRPGDATLADELVDRAVTVARDHNAPGIERYALRTLQRTDHH
jgi:hypothetical protein